MIKKQSTNHFYFSSSDKGPQISVLYCKLSKSWKVRISMNKRAILCKWIRNSTITSSLCPKIIIAAGNIYWYSHVIWIMKLWASALKLDLAKFIWKKIRYLAKSSPLWLQPNLLCQCCRSNHRKAQSIPFLSPFSRCISLHVSDLV